MSKTREGSPPESSASSSSRAELKQLPSVEKLLTLGGFAMLSQEFGRTSVLETTRSALADLRERVVRGMAREELDAALENLESEVATRIRDVLQPSLRSAVNATGIVVHTNLGRAPLSSRAIAALSDIARSYTTLELELETGKRGSRHRHGERLLEILFPGKTTIVVNNAAAALLLSLNTLARGKEVVISRGELVEIGGSFRVPEILERSGARLREVGTTNKTRVADYARAIGPETGAILRVHPSNFRIVGFAESAPTEELVRLAEEKSLPMIEDFGSGNLVSLARFGLPKEPTVSESLASGVHLCVFSGDKLLGGPQAGFLVGEAPLVEACRRNPMSRALRVDKLVYAALEATLSSYVREKATEEIPVLRMLAMSPDEVRRRAVALLERLPKSKRLALEVQESTSRVGGGAAPDAEIPTWVISVTKEGASADAILAQLRANRPPVIARISEDRVLLDLRTVAPEEERILERAFKALEASD